MTPEQLQRLEKLEAQMVQIQASDRYVFGKNLQLTDGTNIQTGNTTGTKIGAVSTQKLAFWGATPVTQQASIAFTGGGAGASDGAARDKIDSIITLLKNVGLMAP